MEGTQWERFVDKRRNTLRLCFHSNHRFLSLSVCRLIQFCSLSPVFSVFGSRSLSFYLSYIQLIGSHSASVSIIRCAITLLQIEPWSRIKRFEAPGRATTSAHGHELSLGGWVHGGVPRGSAGGVSQGIDS